MANSFFRFKKFTVHQDKCAMKVGTDGVLLGCWAESTNPAKILDIGTGTGLIALMLAQRFSAKIDAIDIEKNAIQQAEDNFRLSPWKEQLTAYNFSLEEFSSQCKTKYDLIVCNPPYFANSLLSKDDKRNIARHNTTLELRDIPCYAAGLLESKGNFCIIIPEGSVNEVITSSEKQGLFCNKKLFVKPTPKKQVKRILLSFSFNEEFVSESVLVIEQNGRNEYSNEFKELTSEFYLNH